MSNNKNEIVKRNSREIRNAHLLRNLIITRTSYEKIQEKGRKLR